MEIEQNSKNIKDIKKQITLKYKTVQRLVKEHDSYTKEINKLQEKLTTEEESGVEEYYINKSKSNISDTDLTRQDTIKKLKKFLEELVAYISEITEQEVMETEEYKTAKEWIDKGLLIVSPDN